MSRRGLGVLGLATALLLPTTAAADVSTTGDRVTRTMVSADGGTPCSEDRGVVGHRACPSFGTWGIALASIYTTVGFGVSARHLPQARGVGASSGAVAARSTSTTTPTTEGDVSYGYVERVTFGMPVAYLGIEAEIGLSDVVPTTPQARAMGAGGLALIGLRGGLGPVVLGAELAAGGRLIETASSDRHLAGEGAVEARARADLWLTPWVTLGASVGSSLLHHEDWLVGASLGFHTWAYGGRR